MIRNVEPTLTRLNANVVDLRTDFARVLEKDQTSVTRALNLIAAVAKADQNRGHTPLENLMVLRHGGPDGGEPLSERVEITAHRVSISFPHLNDAPFALKAIYFDRQNPAAIHVEMDALEMRHIDSRVSLPRSQVFTN